MTNSFQCQLSMWGLRKGITCEIKVQFVHVCTSEVKYMWKKPTGIRGTPLTKRMSRRGAPGATN